MSLSIIVIELENREALSEIYGADAVRDLGRAVSQAIRDAAGKEPRISAKVPGSFLLVLPGMTAEMATELAKRVDRRIPHAFGRDGLLMPVEVQVVVETHDGSDRAILRLGRNGMPSAVAA